MGVHAGSCGRSGAPAQPVVANRAAIGDDHPAHDHRRRDHLDGMRDHLRVVAIDDHRLDGIVDQLADVVLRPVRFDDTVLVDLPAVPYGSRSPHPRTTTVLVFPDAPGDGWSPRPRTGATPRRHGRRRRGRSARPPVAGHRIAAASSMMALRRTSPMRWVPRAPAVCPTVCLDGNSVGSPQERRPHRRNRLRHRRRRRNRGVGCRQQPADCYVTTVDDGPLYARSATDPLRVLGRIQRWSRHVPDSGSPGSDQVVPVPGTSVPKTRMRDGSGGHIAT